MRQLNVAAFTQGENVPSARFRVRQLIAPLRDEGVIVHESPAAFGAYPPPGIAARLAWLPRAWIERRRAIGRAMQHDIALFQREQISTLGGVELHWGKPAVLDVDDAIWLSQRWRSIDCMAQRIGTVICGNSYIAEHFAPLADVHIIPTAVDTSRYQPGHVSPEPVMVWSGSASGLPFLQAIDDALGRVLRAVPKARLRVVCNVPPVLTRIPAAQLEFVPWHPDTEVAALQTAAIGLMPMPDTPWTRGKCSFKMLTYMACGLPVVVSPYGMNAEVLARGDIGHGASTPLQWEDALVSLLHDSHTAQQLGRQGRRLVETHYASSVITPRLAQILRAQAGI